MTEGPFSEMMKAPESGFDAWAPENVSPLVVWLGSKASSAVTGRVFEIQGGMIQLADGWRPGPRVDQEARWRPEDIGDAVASLLRDAQSPVPAYGA